MARKITWTKRAQNDRYAIFSFLNNQNRTNLYSKQLQESFIKLLILISKYPFIGKRTNRENTRIKVLKNYLIIYKVTDKQIFVLSIRDSRQNPEDLKEIIK